jgi:hypothetical protein
LDLIPHFFDNLLPVLQAKAMLNAQVERHNEILEHFDVELSKIQRKFDLLTQQFVDFEHNNWKVLEAIN